jgi:hypothetical protein
MRYARWPRSEVSALAGAARALDEEWGDEWNRGSAAVILRQLADAEHLPTLRRA